MHTKLKIGIVSLLVCSFTIAHSGNPNTQFTIDTTHPHQTIEGFGASDAWSMKYIGLWPADKQREIADWLFSTEEDAKGKPQGIGLSIWRFNLGTGSEEQGDSSYIQPSTRTDCFLQADGFYNWNKQAGQRSFLQLAKQRGVPYFLAFLNSPPVYYTQNGLATNTGRDATYNLRPDCYDSVALFISNSIKGLQEHDGIHINYLSPVNEPDGHWNWTGPKQEGTPATNREIARLVKCISRQLMKDGIKTDILVNESSDYRCLMGIYKTDWQRGNTLRTLFSKDSTDTYLGTTPLVKPVIAAHSYWTNTPLTALHDVRCALRDSVKKLGIGLWQTELCIMGNDEEIGGGGGFDFTMKTALYVARVIHHDLVMADAGSWQWWRAVGGDYKDGLINVQSNDDMKTGIARSSKLMWTLGNYSRFIRPGAVRYAITAIDIHGHVISEGDTDPQGLMCSAYHNTDGSWIVVAINYSDAAKPFRITLGSEKAIRWQLYRTSDHPGDNLIPAGICRQGTTTLPPRSVTTMVSPATTK